MSIVSTLPSRFAVIGEHKGRGGRVAAVLPIHYSRALFRAFGILPVELWGPPQIDPGRGMAHLQPYICSVVRNALSFFLADDLNFADLIIAPHACDSLQGLGSILIDFIHPQQPVIPLYIPRGNRDSDALFLAAEFRSVYRRLAGFTGLSPSDAELMDCVRREEEADRLLSELHRRRKNLALSQSEFYRLIRAREYLPAEVFSGVAGSALAAAAADTRPAGVPIILSGIVPEPMSLFDALSQINGLVVADDLACCGRRLYPAGAGDDPFARMAQSILSGPPDASRGSSIQDRLAHLRGLAEASGAKGVVFYDVKFCEPELFYLPALRRGLQEAGLPSAAVEVDINDPLPHQTLTRIEAFLEMIA